MDPSTIGKEVGHPLIPKIRVKTKVKSSLSQVPVSSLAQGSSGSFDFIPQSPLGPSGRTRSRQKTIGESVEKREGQGLFPSSLFYFTVIHCCYCAFLFFLLQVEVPLPMTGGTLVKEVIIAPSAVPLGVEIGRAHV